MNNRAFTLVELLVVIGIMALLSSMIILSHKENPIDSVSASAHELQSVLQRARSLAMRHGTMHGVTFHIQNSGDGSVLKNASFIEGVERADGHWYCIVGPDTSDYDYRSTSYPPRASLGAFFTLEDYMKAMKNVQIGPRYKLMPGSRFLAMGDVDDLYAGNSYVDSSYPRPWFGYYDEVNKTLYPWGGYNREIDALLKHPNTGLDYAGNDGEISYDRSLDTNINPTSVWGRIHLEATADHQIFLSSGANDPYIKKYIGTDRTYMGPDQSLLASTVNKKNPRPLMNAMWADFMVLFDATGAAFVTDSHGRLAYISSRGYTSSGSSPYNNSGTTPYGANSGRQDMGIVHETAITGGFYITICRDVDSNESIYHEENPLTGQPSYNKFESKEDALISITPFIRVFVNQASGVAELRDEEFPDLKIQPADLLQRDPYPRSVK